MYKSENERTVRGSGEFKIANDIPVFRLGFGAMRLTGDGIWGEPADPGEAKRVLRRALELEINFIDTADSYGPEVSERLIAETLYPYPRGLLIATKAGLLRPGPDKWKPDGRPAHLREAVEGSLRRLRVDQIDLLQLHRIDSRVPLEDQVGALKDLQTAGKIRHIGLSEVSVEQIEAARRIAPIVTVQNKYSIVNQAADDVLEYCEREGMGFIPWFPLSAGDVASKGGAVARAAAELNVTPAQLALAWLLWRSPVMLPIPGTSKVNHLEENVAAAGLRLAPEKLRELV